MDKTIADIAVRNISQFGDTDIFPYPIENAAMFDMPDDMAELLVKISKDFRGSLSRYPVDNISTCIPVGFTGFRWATQIDPLWNAYLLAAVVSISADIEKSRISAEKSTIFSYRISSDFATGKLFSDEINWRAFIEETIKIASSESYTYVVRLDISDFYSRIYHHRLENSLNRCTKNSETVKQIMFILQDLSGNNSYGLPIGGNAARILAELLLNSVDECLLTKRMRFCRYVDDFVIFCKSKEDSFHVLNIVADFLMSNEGLTLQKAKTQIMSCTEYLIQARSLIIGDDDPEDKKRVNFLNLKLNFDPYSDTAVEDYESIKAKINQFDVNSLLIQEVRKSRIHQALGRQLLNAVSFLEGEKLGLAFSTITANCDAFYPVFPSVLRTINKTFEKVPERYAEEFISYLCKMIDSESYIVQNDNTLAYAVRTLSRSNMEIAGQCIDKIFSSSSSALVKTNCIYSMVNLRRCYWLSNLRSKFITMSRFERRAFITASYFLGDEGSHWRDHTKSQFFEFELFVRNWAAGAIQKSSEWRLPI